MREGNIFILCVSPHLDTGYPLPRSRLGVPPSQVQVGGTPFPGSGRGTPSQVEGTPTWRGVPPPGKGYPFAWEGGTPPPNTGYQQGVTPHPGQIQAGGGVPPTGAA